MLHIVIPAYNEEERLPRTLRVLRRHIRRHRAEFGAVSVTVVDNASTDATAAVARAADCGSLPVRVVTCAVRGKGAAVRAGLLESGSPDDIVCFMDADGATALDALQRGLDRMAAGADVVIGSREHRASVTEGRHTRTRTAGAACYRALAARLVPGIADTQCGFKMLRADLAQVVAAELVAVGFSFDVELLVRLRAAGAQIEEIPVVWHDVPGSTFVPARDGAGAFWELAAIAWRTRALEAAGASAPARRRTPSPVAVPAAMAAIVVPLAVPMALDALAPRSQRGRR